jgi:hypothetical protein
MGVAGSGPGVVKGGDLRNSTYSSIRLSHTFGPPIDFRSLGNRRCVCPSHECYEGGVDCARDSAHQPRSRRGRRRILVEAAVAVPEPKLATMSF